MSSESLIARTPITLLQRSYELLTESLPAPSEFKKVLAFFIITDTALLVYLALSAIINSNQPELCLLDQPKFTNSLIRIIAPFWLVKLAGYFYFHESVMMVLIQIVAFFLSQVAIGIWEL